MGPKPMNVVAAPVCHVQHMYLGNYASMLGAFGFKKASWDGMGSQPVVNPQPASSTQRGAYLSPKPWTIEPEPLNS